MNPCFQHQIIRRHMFVHVHPFNVERKIKWIIFHNKIRLSDFYYYRNWQKTTKIHCNKFMTNGCEIFKFSVDEENTSLNPTGSCSHSPLLLLHFTWKTIITTIIIFISKIVVTLTTCGSSNGDATFNDTRVVHKIELL